MRTVDPSSGWSFPATLQSLDLDGRTYLLGNGQGFVFHQPVSVDASDPALMPSKWFGAAAFGRHYLLGQRLWLESEQRLWLESEQRRMALDRANQTVFTQYAEGVVLKFEGEDVAVRQETFVPDGLQAVIVTVSVEGRSGADRWPRIIVEPRFDMRYYQALNTDLSGYAAGVEGTMLHVSNHIPPPTPASHPMEFHAVCILSGEAARMRLRPENERVRKITFDLDMRRRRDIEAAYVETRQSVPDEAPIWNVDTGSIYVPAHLSAKRGLQVVYGFGAIAEEAEDAARQAARSPQYLRRRKGLDAAQAIDRGFRAAAETDEANLAYAQVQARFNACLVARDVCFHGENGHDDRFTGIFAGDKYFLDPWKRDENISLGALLTGGDFETARTILDNTWRFQNRRTGRLPQLVRLGEKLVYYSSDGTPWALHRLHQYTRMSGDTSLLDRKYRMVEHFFSASLPFVKRGLLPSGGIIDKLYLWETWEDTPFTPRAGYPVEIELLWLAALRDYLPTVEDRNPALAARLRETLQEGTESFKLFHLDGYLADSLSYDWEPRHLLTPNGWIAFETGHPLPPEMIQSMLKLGHEQLAGHVGIRSLAPRDWPQVLAKAFLDDPKNVQGKDMASVGLYNYHRGIEWLWFNQFFVMAELRYGDVQEAYDRYLSGPIHAALHSGGMGGLSELYDLHGPLGADFQAWSMASLLVSMRSFTGVEVDAISKRVTVNPATPREWQSLTTRHRVGNTHLEVHLGRPTSEGREISVQLLDPIPDGYTLRIAQRVPECRFVSDSWGTADQNSKHEDGLIWIEGLFTDDTTVLITSQK